MANATTNAILDNIRSRLPGVTDDVAKLEMFNTVDELAREALRVAAPTGIDAEPDTWLTSTLWVPNYQVILEGTLARLYVQANKPWSAPELAKVHSDRYMILLGLARSEASASPTTIYERLLFNLRAKIPMARDVDLTNAIYAAANKIRVDALNLGGLTATDTTPSLWLPADKWDECFQAMLYGSLAHLYAEVGRPWAVPEMAVATQGQFNVELALLRGSELTTITTFYDRLTSTIRAALPQARENIVRLAAFEVADKIRVDALNLAAISDPTTVATSWLPTDKWAATYPALLRGTLSRLYAQPGQPWSAPELAAANEGLFQQELTLLRSDELSAPTTLYGRVINAVRAQAPTAREGVVKLAVFAATNKIRVDALGLAPLLSTDTDPATWLPADKWDDGYLAALYGTLARLLSQVNQPWSAPELAIANEAMFQQELSLLRSDTLSAPTTLYERIINAVRVQAPTARESVVKLAAFAVADKIRIDALGLAPLLATDTDPTSWLPSDKWDECYQAVLYGTLARQFAQQGQPWSAPELAVTNEGLFVQELMLLRSDVLAAPTTLYERIINTVRAQAPLARESVVKLAAFAIVDKIRIDALSLAPLLSTDTDPTTWLPTDKWDDCYQAVLYGTLARLFAQPSQPWSAPDLALANEGLFQQELALLRSDELASPTTIYGRLVNTIRAQLPTARESVIKLAIFAVADKIRIDALRLTPLVDASTDPTTWIPSDKWDDCYQALLYGTLSRLQMQAGQPWTAPDAATANNMLFMEEFVLLRGDDASAPTTVFDRLVNNIRVKIPGLRDGVIKLEIYNTVDKVRREALRLTPLTDTDTLPTSWLPSDKWDDCYQVILHGTLARLYAQSGAAWAEPNLAAAQFALYQTELELVRNDTASSAAREFDKVMDMARARLPGARDNIIKLEFVAVMAEFFQQSNCWREDITFKVTPGKTVYDVFPTQVSTIVRLLEVKNSSGSRVGATMPEPGSIKLFNQPSQEDTYTATVALSVDDPVDRDGVPVFPDWFMTKYSYDLLEGLCARMMSQLAKPYTQPQLAAVHRRQFMSAINVARAEAMHEQTYQGQRWSFPQTFARRKARY